VTKKNNEESKKGSGTMKKPFIVIAVLFVVTIIPMNSQEEVIFRVAMLDEPKTLNPFSPVDLEEWHIQWHKWDWYVYGYFYEPLLIHRPIDLEVVPNVALEVPEVSSNDLEYTVRLRDDLYWSDGKPLTAHDYALFGNMIKEFQIDKNEIYKGVNLERYFSSWEFVEIVEAIDDYTLYFKLSECKVEFIEGTLMSIPIPSHIWGPKLAGFRAAANPTRALQDYQPIEPDEVVSCGPLIFEEWERGSYIKCVKNNNYGLEGKIYTYDDGTELVVGPYFDFILYKLYDNTEAAILDLKKGEIDYIWWNLDPEYVNDLEVPNIAIAYNAMNGRFYYLAFNCQREPWSEVCLKQALAILIDRESILTEVPHDYSEPLYGLVSPANKEWYNPDITMWGKGLSREERIAEAVNLLKGCGKFSWDVEPSVDENGNITEGKGMKYKGEYIQPFDILTPTASYDLLRAMAGKMIEEWWRQIGLPATVRYLEFNTLGNKVMNERDYDVFIMGWGGSRLIYPGNLREFFHSSNIYPGGYNFPNYSNPKYDRFADRLLTCGSRESRILLAFRLQEYLAEELPYVTLYNAVIIEAYRNDHFAGWIDQLDGIGGSVVYIRPVVEEEKEEEVPIEEPVEEPEDAPIVEVAAAVTAGGAVIWGVSKSGILRSSSEGSVKSIKGSNSIAHAKMSVGNRYEKAAEKALSIGNLEEAIRLYKKAAHEWGKLKNLLRAQQAEEKAAQTYEKIGLKAVEADDLSKAGDCYEKAADSWRKTDKIGNIEKTIELYEKAADIWTKKGNTEKTQEIIEKTAEVYGEAGALAHQIREFQRTAEFCEKAASLWRKTGNIEKAVKFYKKAANMQKKLEDTRKAQEIEENIAGLYEEAALKAQEADEFQRAGDNYEKAAYMWRKIGNRRKAKQAEEKALTAYEKASTS
jgi:peptide/nickel transport system substrate-binding protein